MCTARRFLALFVLSRLGIEGLLSIDALLCVSQGQCQGLAGLTRILLDGRIVAGVIMLGLLALAGLTLFLEALASLTNRYAIPAYGAVSSLLALATAAGYVATHASRLLEAAITLYAAGIALCLTGFASTRHTAVEVLGARNRWAGPVYVLQGLPLIGPLAGSLLLFAAWPRGCQNSGSLQLQSQPRPRLSEGHSHQ